MSIGSTVNSDIRVNQMYGDIEFIGKDLSINKRRRELIYNVLIERFKTNWGELPLNPSYGASLDDLIGKGIDTELVESIITKLRYAATYDGFLNEKDIEIIPLIIKHEIKVYIYLSIDVEKELVAIATYNKEGLSFD